MVPLDHLGVLARSLRLQLYEDSVEKLAHLLGDQSPLAICDEGLHWAEVADPT